jgi:hypothetical protein
MPNETQSRQIGGFQALGTVVDRAVMRKRYRALQEATRSFLRLASYKIANDDNYSYAQFIQEASARGVNDMPEVKEYATVVKEAEERRRTEQGRQKRSAMLSSLATKRVPIEQVSGSLPPGMPVATGGAQPEVSPAPGFEVGGGPQALTTRPQTETEVFQATGLPRSQLMAQAEAEAVDPDLAKIVRDNFKTTQQALNLAMQNVSNLVSSTGQQVGVTGAGGEPTVTPRDVLSGEVGVEFTGKTQPRYLYRPPSAGFGVEQKEEKLLLDYQKEINDAIQALGTFGKSQTRMQGAIAGLKTLLENYANRAASLGRTNEEIDAQLDFYYYQLSAAYGKDVAGRLMPERVPQGTGAPAGGGEGKGAGVPGLNFEF